MKKIAVIEMGGTISAQGVDRLDLKDYISGKYSGEHFLKHLPEIQRIADVIFDPFLHVSSTKITTEHWLKLRQKVITYLNEDNFDGVVITHGTNTVEETAYFLHLTI